MPRSTWPALMHHRPWHRWAAGLCKGLLAALFGALLAGCAAMAPAPSPEPLLDDALFGHPARPVGADEVFALSEPMRQHLRRLLQSHPHPSTLPSALAHSLYRPGELKLDYDASTTRNAAEAFAARAGNCLSLVVMTAALARELGLEVGYRAVVGEQVLRSEAGLTLRAGHVNLELGPPRQHLAWNGRVFDVHRELLLIDFLSPEEAWRLPTEPITEARVLAMVANNRAVESLIARQPALAYAWAREALRHDRVFWPAYNTLGVVYQRAGHLGAAAAAFEQVLQQDPQRLEAMGNLAQVRQAQGRHAEAAAWAQRLRALEPFAPGHFLNLGLAALEQGDGRAARRHFDREMRTHGPSSDLWLGLARAHLLRGDRRQAEQALGRAVADSVSPAEQARYAGKLDALRAAVVQ